MTEQSLRTSLIIFFILIFGLLIFSYLNEKDNKKHKDLKNLIGVIILCLVAIYSSNAFVYAIAVVVSSLIIASEKFMAVLMAIIRSSDKFLISGNFAHMIDNLSSTEVVQRNIEEINEIEKVESETINTENSTKNSKKTHNKKQGLIHKRDYLQKIPAIEQLALDKFESGINFKLRRQVKIEGIIFDAVGISSKNNTVYLVEVKVFPNVIDENNGIKTDSVIKRIDLYLPSLLTNINSKLVTNNPQLRYCFMNILVLNTDENLDRLMERVVRHKLTYQNLDKINIKFNFYNLNKLYR